MRAWIVPNSSKNVKLLKLVQLGSLRWNMCLSICVRECLHFKILRTDSLQILIIIFVLIIEMKKKPIDYRSIC